MFFYSGFTGVYINSAFVQRSEFFLTDLDVYTWRKSWWFQVSECILCLETVFCGSKKQRNAQFPCQTARRFDMGYVSTMESKLAVILEMRQLSLQLVRDMPHLYKIQFQENKHQKKHPQRPGGWTPRPDACPQPGPEKEKRRSGTWGSWRSRSVGNKASRCFVYCNGWMYVAGIKWDWDPVFWEGIKLDVKMLLVNFRDSP